MPGELGSRLQGCCCWGEAGQALFARAFALTRRFETKNGWLRPDLSVFPAVPAKK